MPKSCSLFRQTTGCILLIAGLVSKRIGSRSNIALIVGGVSGSIAQRIRAGSQEALSVITISNLTAIGIGTLGNLALLIVFIVQAAAVFLCNSNYLMRSLYS